MTTLKVKKHVNYTGTIEDYPDIEFDLAFPPDEYHGTTVVKRADGNFVIGYLVHDDYTMNPLDECDGMGKIGSSDSRDASREMHEIYQKALGLYSDWSPRVNSAIIADELADQENKDIRKVAEEYNENSRWYWRPRKGFKHKWQALVEQHRKDGDFGDPNRVMLDVYKHSGTSYSVQSSIRHYPFTDPWDTALGGAVWVPDDELIKYLKDFPKSQHRAKLEEWAGQCVQTMNSWMEGDCWGVVVQVNDPEGKQIGQEDACWGYLGSDYAKEELNAQIEREVERSE